MIMWISAIIYIKANENLLSYVYITSIREDNTLVCLYNIL